MHRLASAAAANMGTGENAPQHWRCRRSSERPGMQFQPISDAVDFPKLIKPSLLFDGTENGITQECVGLRSDIIIP